jgi:hypothetical protein
MRGKERIKAGFRIGTVIRPEYTYDLIVIAAVKGTGEGPGTRKTSTHV